MQLKKHCLREREERKENYNSLNDHLCCLSSCLSFLAFDPSLPIFLFMFNEILLKIQSFHWRAPGVDPDSHEHTDLLRSEHQRILLKVSETDMHALRKAAKLGDLSLLASFFLLRFKQSEIICYLCLCGEEWDLRKWQLY